MKIDAKLCLIEPKQGLGLHEAITLYLYLIDYALLVTLRVM